MKTQVSGCSCTQGEELSETFKIPESARENTEYWSYNKTSKFYAVYKEDATSNTLTGIFSIFFPNVLFRMI